MFDRSAPWYIVIIMFTSQSEAQRPSASSLQYCSVGQYTIFRLTTQKLALADIFLVSIGNV